MINHIQFKGKAKFKKENKIIIVVIRKQPGELDWILPILNNIKNNFNIIVIFEKKIALKLLKENKILYNLFLETVFAYIQNSLLKSLFLRLANKISIFFKIGFLSDFLKNKIFTNYYNTYDLEKNIKKITSNFKNQNIKILMQDFTDNSPWVKKFYEKNKNLKIISYPHTTNIYSNKKNRVENKINYNSNNFLLLCSSFDMLHFKKKFNQSNKFICGFPKYEKSWLNKIEKFYRGKSKKNKNILIAYKGFEKKKYSKSMYIDQVKALFDFAVKNKKIVLVIKFHPNVQEEDVFMNVANKYPKHLWKITKEHLHIAAKKSDIFISFYANAPILDSLASGKIPIQLWNISNNQNLKSVYSELKLCFMVKDSFSLVKKLNFILLHENLLTQNKFLNRFKKICQNSGSIGLVKKLLLKITKLSS